MPAEIKRYRLESAEVFRSDDGNNAYETIIVDGLTQSADDRILHDAMVQGGVPQIGDSHAYLSNCRVKTVRGVPIDTTTVKLRVTYGPAQAPGLPEGGLNAKWLVEEDVSNIQVQTEINRDGEPIQVEYFSTENKKRTRTVSCSQFVPMTTLRASKILNARPPKAWKMAVGKVNSGAFWDETEKGRYLCMGTKLSTNDLGRTYKVQVTFLGNPMGWSTEAVAVLPDGDKVTLESEDTKKVRDGKYDWWYGNGISRVLLYGEADLRSIFNLPFDN